MSQPCLKLVRGEGDLPTTADLRTKILEFRGLGSSRILILRGGILVSIGNFTESLSQAISVGIILVGVLGVVRGEGKLPTKQPHSALD